MHPGPPWNKTPALYMKNRHVCNFDLTGLHQVINRQLHQCLPPRPASLTAKRWLATAQARWVRYVVSTALGACSITSLKDSSFHTAISPSVHTQSMGIICLSTSFSYWCHNLDGSDATKFTSNISSTTSENKPSFSCTPLTRQNAMVWDHNSSQLSKVCKPEIFEMYVA